MLFKLFALLYADSDVICNKHHKLKRMDFDSVVTEPPAPPAAGPAECLGLHPHIIRAH